MYKFELPTKDLNKINNVLTDPGGIIAFPTDTVWGLGCIINNKQAVDRIYSIKERPKNKPLILLGSKIDDLVPYIDKINITATKIIEKYLPGAVTVILPKSKLTPDYITSGFDTVGIRIPAHVPFIELLNKCVDGHILATTSANISGNKTSICRNDVESDLGNYVDYILDDYGYFSLELESTVVFIANDGKIKILRQGAVNIDI